MANTLINGKIFGELVNDYLEGKGRLSNIAKITDISNEQGNTVTVPVLKYLGDATEVVNGVLNETDVKDETEEIVLKQFGKSVKMTDMELSNSLLDRNLSTRARQTAESLVGQMETSILAVLEEKAPVFQVSKIDKDSVLDAQGFFGAKLDDREHYIICNSVTRSKLQKGLLTTDSRVAYNTVYDSKILTVPTMADDTYFLVQAEVIEIFKKEDILTEIFRESGFVGEKIRSTRIAVPAVVSEDRLLKVTLSEQGI